MTNGHLSLPTDLSSTPIFRLTRIPCVDIINYSPNADSGFGDFWHTHDDNMDVIDRATLNAVGRTVMEVVYNEK